MAPYAESIDPWVALAVIMDQARDSSEIELNELLTGKKNIGKVFNLDVITMIDILHEIEKTGTIKIIRTAGLDIIRIEQKYTFNECVDHYYKVV